MHDTSRFLPQRGDDTNASACPAPRHHGVMVKLELRLRLVQFRVMVRVCARQC